MADTPMCQWSLKRFEDETIPGAPVTILGIQKIKNHYFDDADWCHIDQKTRAAIGLKYGNDKATRFHNKKALLRIKPGTIGRDPHFKCLLCKRQHDDPKCTYSCYKKMRGKFNIASKKLEIRKTNSVGDGNHQEKDCPPVYGIFVKDGQRIRKDEWLGEYIGRLIPSDLPHMEWSDYVYTLDGGDFSDQPLDVPRLQPLEIDSLQLGNWTRFMNHHCKPNVSATDTQAGKIRMMGFKANRTIEANQEVFINYGTAYFTGRGWQCRCPRMALPHTPI